MKKNILKKISIILGCIIGMIFVAVIGFYIYIATTTKFNINDFEKELKNNKNIIYVNYEELPKDLINAVLSAEDPTFFEHKGHDFSKYLKSFYSESKYMSIEMQLINESLLDENIYFKKFRLAYLSQKQITKKYNKNELLELYLNYSYFGEEIYGIENASLKYFNKKTSELNLAESAALAGLLQAPNVYSSDLEKFEDRKDTVLMLMNRYGYLDNEYTNKIKSITIESLLKGNVHSEINVISENEFIDYIKKTNEYLEISDQFNLNYKDVKYEALKNQLNEYAYTYKIYYKNQEINFGDDYYSKIYDGYAYYNPEIYYLDNDVILIISTITPVAAFTTYDVRAFNMSGEVIFGDIVTGELIFDEDRKELYYQQGYLKETWLGMSDGNICEIIEELDDNYIAYGGYIYKFSDNGVEELKKEVITIQDFREEYNCK